jgi:hypothetical protein
MKARKTHGVSFARSIAICDWGYRMGEALYAKLEDAAKKSGVTMTAEAINRLEASFGNDPNAALIKKTARAIAVAIVDEINRRDEEKANG